MQQELRTATIQAFDAAGVACSCYRNATRQIWKGDKQLAQLFERMGDMYMAINAKAKEEIAFLEWAIAVDEAHTDGYWPE